MDDVGAGVQDHQGVILALLGCVRRRIQVLVTELDAGKPVPGVVLVEQTSRDDGQLVTCIVYRDHQYLAVVVAGGGSYLGSYPEGAVLCCCHVQHEHQGSEKHKNLLHNINCIYFY